EENGKIARRVAHDFRVLPLIQCIDVDTADTELRERARKRGELFPSARLYLEVELRGNARGRVRTLQCVDVRLQRDKDVGKRVFIDINANIRTHYVARDLEPLHIH